jgi:hypothetical protein
MTRALAAILFFITLAAFVGFACGSVRGGGVAIGVQIPGPSGVRCYAIQEDGRTVAGNCLKE